MWVSQRSQGDNDSYMCASDVGKPPNYKFLTGQLCQAKTKHYAGNDESSGLIFSPRGLRIFRSFFSYIFWKMSWWLESISHTKYTLPALVQFLKSSEQFLCFLVIKVEYTKWRHIFCVFLCVCVLFFREPASVWLYIVDWLSRMLMF